MIGVKIARRLHLRLGITTATAKGESEVRLLKRLKLVRRKLLTARVYLVVGEREETSTFTSRDYLPSLQTNRTHPPANFGRKRYRAFKLETKLSVYGLKVTKVYRLEYA